MSALQHDNDGPGDGWCGDATSVVEFLRPLREQLDAPGVLVNFRAESEGISTDAIIDELLERVPVPASGM